jgi:hypothetical protein
MSKKLTLGLLLLFLCVQAFSLWHMAEHGFEKHQHHGQTCDIYAFCHHQGNTGDLPVALIVLSFGTLLLVFGVLSFSVENKRYHHFSDPRAPPAIIL